ncbi:hypothetical protein NLJ89_g8501 [Agrocybe chaxingu]|uniref:Uncharacterized protein n=1 Tax=Agrocybe chaxingu TaxID=84603 RepID=A0A9W8JVB6_9AGAR|nr:hypothetical protein NLJ89_g8501 [Agrocybe chaxingu]
MESSLLDKKVLPPSYQATSSQPQATTPMSIPNGGDRNVRKLPLDEEGKRDWSFDILDCLGDVDTYCLACWCPCLAHAHNRRRLLYLNAHGVPHPNREQVVEGDSVIYAAFEAFFGAGWLLQVFTRGGIRERYSIRGNGAHDFVAAFCCQTCDLVQGSRELRLEEESFENQRGAASA